MLRKNQSRERIRWILTQWGHADEIIEELEQELWEIRERIAAETDVHPAPITGLPGGSKKSDSTAAAAQRHAAAAARHASRIEYLSAQRDYVQQIVRMVDAALAELKPIEKIVLIKRYRRGKNCQEIANQTSYSYDGVRAINDSALDKLTKIMRFEEDEETVPTCTNFL